MTLDAEVFSARVTIAAVNALALVDYSALVDEPTQSDVAMYAGGAQCLVPGLPQKGPVVVAHPLRLPNAFLDVTRRHLEKRLCIIGSQ